VRVGAGGRILGWIAAAALISSACAGVRPRSDWDREASFDGLDSFTVLPAPTLAAESDVEKTDPYGSPIVIERARRAVAAALTEAGYLETAKDRADFWVATHFATQEKVEVYNTGATFGRRGFWVDGRTITTSYTEGTLIIDVIDPKSDRMIWRGWASEELRGAGQSPERIQKVVDAIIGLFPPLPAQGGSSARPDS
jgi:hypothetical protein